MEEVVEISLKARTVELVEPVAACRAVEFANGLDEGVLGWHGCVPGSGLVRAGPLPATGDVSAHGG